MILIDLKDNKKPHIYYKQKRSKEKSCGPLSTNVSVKYLPLKCIGMKSNCQSSIVQFYNMPIRVCS